MMMIMPMMMVSIMMRMTDLYHHLRLRRTTKAHCRKQHSQTEKPSCQANVHVSLLQSALQQIIALQV
jgi:hypothetical protein